MSNRELPIGDEHGERIWFVSPCAPNCAQAKDKWTFPHTHDKDKGHFINGETWWTGTPQQVTVYHPISEEKVTGLTTVELATYIMAIEIYPARRLVLQDDNDYGWRDRGWITELGIAMYAQRREHSVTKLKEELTRRMQAGLIPTGADGQIDEAALFSMENHVRHPSNALSTSAQPKLLAAASASNTVLPF